MCLETARQRAWRGSPPTSAILSMRPVAHKSLCQENAPLGSLTAWRLLTLAEIERSRAQMNALVQAGRFAGGKATLPSCEQTDWWPAGWVPIADNSGGDFACLDMTGTNTGGLGRVVQFRHDSPKRKVFAPSFGQWLDTLADELEAGRYHFDPGDFGLVEVEGEE